MASNICCPDRVCCVAIENSGGAAVVAGPNRVDEAVLRSWMEGLNDSIQVD